MEVILGILGWFPKRGGVRFSSRHRPGRNTQNPENGIKKSTGSNLDLVDFFVSSKTEVNKLLRQLILAKKKTQTMRLFSSNSRSRIRPKLAPSRLRELQFARSSRCGKRFATSVRYPKRGGARSLLNPLPYNSALELRRAFLCPP